MRKLREIIGKAFKRIILTSQVFFIYHYFNDIKITARNNNIELTLCILYDFAQNNCAILVDLLIIHLF